MNSHRYILFLVLLCLSVTVQAQKKKRTQAAKQVPAVETKKEDNKKKRDTVIVIVDSRGNELNPKPRPVTVYVKDTVIVLSKGRQKKMLKEPGVDTPKIVVNKVNEECKCMTLTIVAPDTLQYETYVNYAFRFKNNCKKMIWVSSESFSMFIFNPNGTPARVLRKLQYTKQYKYPPFVPISPGEEYEFSYADDPFFQYDLRKGWKYKFTFGHFSPKFKKSSGDTYDCTELRDKMISVK